VGASTTGTSYDVCLQVILEGHDPAHLDRAGHLQQDHNPLRSDPLSHVPLQLRILCPIWARLLLPNLWVWV
jgi:hypothetical protein